MLKLRQPRRSIIRGWTLTLISSTSKTAKSNPFRSTSNPTVEPTATAPGQKAARRIRRFFRAYRRENTLCESKEAGEIGSSRSRSALLSNKTLFGASISAAHFFYWQFCRLWLCSGIGLLKRGAGAKVCSRRFRAIHRTMMIKKYA